MPGEKWTAPYKGIEPLSFNVGMMEAFCELVGKGAKPVALSPLFHASTLEEHVHYSELICEKYGVKSYTELHFPPSALVPDAALEDMAVILYYTDDALLNRYHAIRDAIWHAVESKGYTDALRSAKTAELERLLGYPESPEE